jgi:U3 small nucleolar RNA-associated protein 14
MAGKKTSKKRSKKIKLDVYTADDGDLEADKLMRRRGGGGGLLGRTMDTQETVDYIKETIDPSDDEEITEDDAFDDSDEDKFGLFFTQSKKKKSKTNELDLNEQDESMASESDVDGDEYVDLSEMLKDESENETMLIPEQSDSELDLGGSDLSEDTDVEVGDLSSVLKVKGEKKRKRVQERTEAYEESEFKVGKDSIRKKLVLTDLVNPVGEETNFAALKSQLEVLEKTQAGAINAPLAPRMQDRLNRQAAKIETEKSISKWTQKVKKNRESDELIVPYNEPASVNLSSGALVGKFEPFTEMEKEINEVLEKSGLTEKKQKEMEELELNKLSKEEVIIANLDD